MIINSFDPSSPEIVNAKDTIPQKDKELARTFSIDTFILTFSGKLIDALLKESLIEPLDKDLTIGSAAYKSPVFHIPNASVGVVLSGIGAPMIAAILEELATLFHARNYIVFGSCGALTALPATLTGMKEPAIIIRRRETISRSEMRRGFHVLWISSALTMWRAGPGQRTPFIGKRSVTGKSVSRKDVSVWKWSAVRRRPYVITGGLNCINSFMRRIR